MCKERRIAELNVSYQTRKLLFMTALYWLRNDLRLHDNEVLTALPPTTTALLPVYCFDPVALGPDAYLDLPRLGVHRLPFLLETLADLQRQYAALGSGIHFVVGRPEEVSRTTGRAEP